MLTPQEIQERKFEKAVFGGYDMGQIDDFLDEVLADYTDLYKENAVLKTKMRVLVEKIDEYRAVDEQMRKALYSAQVTAEKTVTEAKAEGEQILSAAQEESRQMIAHAQEEAQRHCGDIADQVRREEQRLVQMREETRSYADKIKQLMNKNIEVLDTIVGTDTPDPQSEAFLEDAGEAEAPVPEEAPVSVGVAAGVSDETVTIGALEELPPEVPRTDAEKNQTADEIARALLETQPRETQEDPGIMAALELGETRVIDLELGKKADQVLGRRSKKDESDTAKIYGDTARTPKPRFNFSDLRFGRDYQDDEDHDNQ